MTDLTGDFNTGKLPKIAPGTVTVAIARTVAPRNRPEFEQWCHDMTEAVQHSPGCLGATVLWPAKPTDPYQMVFRFVDVLHLRTWERSDIRQQLRARADQLVESEKVTVTAGTEEFFNALGDVERHRSRVHKFFFDVAWVYPAALVFSVVLAPYFAKIEVFPRVLISTIAIGFTSKYATGPIRKWSRRRRMLPQDSLVK
jgi:antibiotic biosynthesis monooxygenase (ABM) superfamily enzyme